MEFSRAANIKVIYFPSLKRNGHHGKGEADMFYIDFQKIFNIFLDDVLM